MRYQTAVRIGPATFRIGSTWRAPIRELEALYRDYPAAVPVPDYTVRLHPAGPGRRWWRRSVAIAGDYRLPEAAPLPLGHGLLAAEMAMNLQMALGWRRQLLLHAAVVERDGRAIILTGESGAGKSTLAALLMGSGWRLLGDEFALVNLHTGECVPFPRPISLKNDSIAAVEAPAGRWGPVLAGTPKGTIRHLIPDEASLAAQHRRARPVALLFPRYGEARATRPVSPSEAFVRLTQASTNYVGLGEAGFRALTRLVTGVPATAIDYPDAATGMTQVEAAWRAG